MPAGPLLPARQSKATRLRCCLAQPESQSRRQEGSRDLCLGRSISIAFHEADVRA